MKGLTIECTVCHVTGSTCPLVHTILQAMVCVSVFIILLTFVNKNISTESSKLHSNIMVTAKVLFLVTFLNLALICGDIPLKELNNIIIYSHSN